MAGPGDCLPPIVSASAVAALPANVLGALASAHVSHADSVAVRFGLAGTALDSATPPAAAASSGLVGLAVLGLLPGRRYSLQVTAFSRCAVSYGDTVELVTGELPADLPRFVAGGGDPSPGFVALAAGAFGLVIDNTGRVVWYYRFPNGPGLNFQPQPNGRYAARPNPVVSGAAAAWVEVTPLGEVTRTLACARGLQPRLHDLIAETDGSYWIMCDDVRTLDLSADGGSAATQVIGTAVQHIADDGELLFEWTPFEHLEFRLSDLDPADRTESLVNWTHGNAIALDDHGNVLLSSRSLSEIIRIDGRTGAVLWRIGGPASQFTLQDAAVPAFRRQHGLRLTDDGRLLLLDNLGDPSASRAELYEVDETAGVVRLAASFGGDAGVIAHLGGSTQSLPGGRVLVAFGNGGLVAEYDASGQVVWQIDGNPGYVFRAQRIESLYDPGHRARPPAIQSRAMAARHAASAP